MIDITPIEVGKTTESEIRNLYGEPLRVTEQFDLRCLVYQATKIFEAILCVDKNGVIVLFSHPVQSDAVTIPDDYPDPIIFYSNYAHGAQTLAFPEQGKTFVVTSTGKIVWAIHHLVMDATTYRKTLGIHFPSENPFLD